MTRRAIVITLSALALLASHADAQQVARRPRALAPQAALPRQQLEARLRQGLWRITKNRVGLTDDQMNRLAQSSRAFDDRRRRLALEEREQRQLMRREILAGPAADQSRVAAALDRVLRIQRERIDLQAEEQRAFTEFMTPVQRAKYAALQEQLRRRAENLRRRRAAQDSLLGADEPR
jgi:hypothetical protein